MNKKTWIIIGVLVVAFGALLGISIWQKNAEANNITNLTSNIDNPFQILEANEASGNLPENIEGKPDAPVIIYQYGDYQCTACAPMNPYINQLKEEYGDNIAIVFRTTIMSYHQNGTAAASAANAVAQQGYWKEYKDLLFANLNDWYYSDADTRQTQFEEYFMKVSDGKGDLEKFRADMGSDAVRKKIDFDESLAQKTGVEFTPSFYVEDEFVGQRKEDNGGKEITTAQFLDKLRAAIDKRLAEKGITNEKKTDNKSESK